MIEWIEKLPDWVLGTAAAAVIWTGFNYAVLAERAMAYDHAEAVTPRCMIAVERADPLSRIPALTKTGTDLDVIVEQWLKPLSPSEKQVACACAARAARAKLRFDYAVYLASFRLISVDAVSSFGDTVVETATTGACSIKRML